MSEPLLWLVTAIYLAVAVNEIVNARPGFAIVFLAYALAQIGLIVSMRP